MFDEIFEDLFSDTPDSEIRHLKRRIQTLTDERNALMLENDRLKNKMRDVRDILDGLGKLKIGT